MDSQRTNGAEEVAVQETELARRAAALSAEVTVEPAAAVAPQVTAGELVERLAVIEEAMRTAMREGVDYGRVPGTDKPGLWKPGGRSWR